jgi:phage terminase large subunit-like protein
MLWSFCRQAFESAARHYVWLDEEVPLPVYTERVLRTMTKHGIVYLSFTPLLGVTDVALNFCPGTKEVIERCSYKIVASCRCSSQRPAAA